MCFNLLGFIFYVSHLFAPFVVMFCLCLCLFVCLLLFIICIPHISCGSILLFCVAFVLLCLVYVMFVCYVIKKTKNQDKTYKILLKQCSCSI